MNYIVMIVVLVLFILGARFFTATKKAREAPPAPSAVEEMFAPAEDAAARKMREMHENQQRLEDQQQKMQQDRLNTYGTIPGQ